MVVNTLDAWLLTDLGESILKYESRSVGPPCTVVKFF